MPHPDRRAPRRAAAMACCACLALAVADARAATRHQIAPDDAATIPAGRKDPLPVAPRVLVNAGRRAQPLREAAVAATVLDAARLRDAGVVAFEQVEARVPTLDLARAAAPFLTSMRVRGVGSLANIPNFEPSVGLFVDGTYRARSGLAVQDLIDVERIEVVRGAQGVAWPKNANAGLVQILTRAPAERLEGYAAVEAGERALWRTRAGLSGPLREGLRARVGVAAGDRDGFIEDAVNGRASGGLERRGARAELALDLGASGELRLAGAGNRQDGDCCAPELQPGALSQAYLAALARPVDLDPRNRRTTYDVAYRSEQTQDDASATLTWEFEGAWLEAATSYDRYTVVSWQDLEQSSLRVGEVASRFGAEAWGQSLRLESTTEGPWRWRAGAYAYDRDARRGSLAPDEPFVVLGEDITALPLPGTPGDAVHFRSGNDSRHLSVFGELSRHFGDHARLGAGLRGIDERQGIDIASATRVASAPSLVQVFTVPQPLEAERDTRGVAASLSAWLAPRERLSLYATVARGFKGGGYNGDWNAAGRTAAQREFDDETVLDYELGLQAEFADGRGDASLALFRSDYSDYQNASFLGLDFVVRNAESMRTQGLEADFAWAPTEALRVDGALAWLDARYRRFTHGSCAYGRVPDDPVQGTCVLDGATLPHAPRWRLALGAEATRALPVGEGFLRLDFAWAASQAVDNALDPRATQGAQGRWNARLGWRGARWSAWLWGENLFDATTYGLAANQTLFGGLDGGLQFYLEEPRSAGAGFEYRFD